MTNAIEGERPDISPSPELEERNFTLRRADFPPGSLGNQCFVPLLEGRERPRGILRQPLGEAHKVGLVLPKHIVRKLNEVGIEGVSSLLNLPEEKLAPGAMTKGQVKRAINNFLKDLLISPEQRILVRAGILDQAPLSVSVEEGWKRVFDKVCLFLDDEQKKVLNLRFGRDDGIRRIPIEAARKFQVTPLHILSIERRALDIIGHLLPKEVESPVEALQRIESLLQRQRELQARFVNRLLPETVTPAIWATLARANIRELNLSTRAFNALSVKHSREFIPGTRVPITEILSMTEEDLLRLRKISKKTVEEIKIKIRSYIEKLELVV